MSKRPIRQYVEDQTEKIPNGPLGIAGRGDLIGLTGYFGVSIVNSALSLTGADIGFDIESHTVERFQDREEHTFTIHSMSRDVARATAKFKSTPTFINAARDRVDVIQTREVEQRRAFTVWEIKTRVQKRSM